MSRVAVIQMTTVADPAHNLREAYRLVEQAAGQGAQLVILPEMFLSLEGRYYPQLAASTDWLETLGNWCRQWQLWLVAGAVPQPDPDPQETRVRSACLVLDDQGQTVARYDKIHLFDAAVGDAHGIYRESERFAPGDAVVVVDTLLRARAIEQQCYVLAANQCGWHDTKRRTWGHSQIIDPWGKVMVKQEDTPGVLCADIDLPWLHTLRLDMPVANHRRL
jgi:deaminated glutathione amidase